MSEVQIISYSDDHCLDCNVPIRRGIDDEHKTHRLLSGLPWEKDPPALSVHIRDGVGSEDKVGG